MDEFSLIEKIKKRIPKSLQGNIGIGDDAGVLTPPPGRELVWTVDAMVDGIDFSLRPKKPGYLTPEQVGRKALAINLSDLAAMGAKPLGCVISLGIPAKMEEKWILKFYDGLIALAKQYKVACVGGDISSAAQFFVSISMAGSAVRGQSARRSGAKPGDSIAVTGALGGSLLSHHALFSPRVLEGQFLTEKFKPTSMIDVSDGLLQDLGHILEKSKAGAVLEMNEIPISQASVRLAKNDPMKALEHASTDGEDFELLFTVKPALKNKLNQAWKKRFPKVPLNWIGKVQKTQKTEWALNGKKIPLKFQKTGFKHFS